MKELVLLRYINARGIALKFQTKEKAGATYYITFQFAINRVDGWYLVGFVATKAYRLYPRKVIVMPLNEALKSELAHCYKLVYPIDY